MASIVDELKLTPLDFFAGGLPAGICFQASLQDLRDILNNQDESTYANTLCQLCLIGLVGYFEALLKDHFASVINCLPNLLIKFRKTHDVQIDATRMLTVSGFSANTLGFVIAEKYDFGTAKKANALYTALIALTPFSAVEAKRYDSVLRTRHLIIHHGGIYTPTFLEQQKPSDPRRDRAYLDSLELDASEVLTIAEFLESIARKLVLATPDALIASAKSMNLVVGDEQVQGFKATGWWISHDQELSS